MKFDALDLFTINLSTQRLLLLRELETLQTHHSYVAMEEWRTPLKGKGLHARNRTNIRQGLPVEPKRRRQGEGSYDVERPATVRERAHSALTTGSQSNASRIRKEKSAVLDRMCKYDPQRHMMEGIEGIHGHS